MSKLGDKIKELDCLYQEKDWPGIKYFFERCSCSRPSEFSFEEMVQIIKGVPGLCRSIQEGYQQSKGFCAREQQGQIFVWLQEQIFAYAAPDTFFIRVIEDGSLDKQVVLKSRRLASRILELMSVHQFPTERLIPLVNHRVDGGIYGNKIPVLYLLIRDSSNPEAQKLCIDLIAAGANPYERVTDRSNKTRTLGEIMRNSNLIRARGGGFFGYPNHEIEKKIVALTNERIREFCRRYCRTYDSGGFREMLSELRWARRHPDTVSIKLQYDHIGLGDNSYQRDYGFNLLMQAVYRSPSDGSMERKRGLVGQLLDLGACPNRAIREFQKKLKTMRDGGESLEQVESMPEYQRVAESVQYIINVVAERTRQEEATNKLSGLTVAELFGARIHMITGLGRESRELDSGDKGKGMVRRSVSVGNMGNIMGPGPQSKVGRNLTAPNVLCRSYSCSTRL